MTTTDASAYVKLHAVHVIDTANNVIDWATQARDKALALAKATDIATATPLATDMAKFADLAYKGNSTKPVKGEGGAMTTYEHAQNMATFVVSTAAPATAPAAATTTAPAAAPTALPKTGSELPLGLLVFGGLILVAVGTGVRYLARRPS